MKSQLLGLSLICMFSTTAFAVDFKPLPPRPLPSNNPQTQTESNSAPTARLNIPNPEASAPQPVGFITREVDLRKPKTGYYIGAYGGLNFLQSTFGTTKVSANASGIGDLTTKSSLGGIGGIKFGYDWPFEGSEPVDMFNKELQDQKLLLSGGIEGDVFGAYIPYKGQDSSGHVVTADFDTFAALINFLLKAQIGDFRPYFGPGIGIAHIWGRNYNALGNKPDGSTTEFAFQMSAGTDYFITPEWSIFADYKWFGMADTHIFNAPELKMTTFGAHFLSFGIRYHY
jgi:opacity protein-like surface antigen